MGARRNSSIELMRIVAMLMIVGAHFCTFALQIVELPLTPYRLALQSTIYPMGKIAVVMFFTISAWFLTEKGGLRIALRRVWLLEREVLFWSVTLLIVCFAVFRSAVDGKIAIKSFAPMISNVWWYATSYAVFLVLCPFIAKGLRLLGRQGHAVLAIALFTLWTIIQGLWPVGGPELGEGTYSSFIYLYVLITYYKWYMKPLSRRAAWMMTGIGFGFIAVWQIGWAMVSARIGSFGWLSDYMSYSETKIAVMMAGFGLFLLFEGRAYSNKAIDLIASAAFGVYLITEYPPIRTVLWGEMSWIRGTVFSPLFLLYSLTAIIAVFSCALVISLLRHWLFSITVDRHRGAWFDVLWERAAASRLGVWLHDRVLKA